jgi:opacity protein-like surface antigen
MLSTKGADVKQNREMNRKIFAISVLLLSALCGYSQVSWNVKAGMNVSKVTNFSDTKMKPGYQFGAGMDYFFTNSWGIQPSLMIVSKGVKWTREAYIGELPDDLPFSPEPNASSNNTENRIYLEMPVMLAYRINLSNMLKLVFNGGGYVSYGIGGKSIFTYNLYDGTTEKYKGDTFSRGEKFDYGLGAGTALEFKHRYTVNLFGVWGLTSADTNFHSFSGKNANHTYGLNIGYKF